jgi:hypothetical protein
MVDASWLPDPSGTHELRYWNGSAWTEHVSDRGTTGVDVPTRELPLPGEAPPPPPPAPGNTNVVHYGSTDAGFAAPAAAGPAAAAKPSWKDRLKQVADQGKAVAEQGRAKLAEQSAKRAEQWANDPSTLWWSESKGGATGAAGVAKARYRITKDRVWIESGLLGTRTESVPLWSVRDMDIRQAVWQRGKDVGDLVLGLDDPAYGVHQDTFTLSAMPEPGTTTSGQVVLDNIEHPQSVYDLLAPLVSEARQKKMVERQTQYVHNVTPGMAPGMAYAPQPAAPAAPDPIEQLRRLGELRDAGVLTDEEFAAQKAKLLG